MTATGIEMGEQLGGGVALRNVLADLAAKGLMGEADDVWSHVVVVEELGRVSPAGIGLSYLAHAHLVLPLLAAHGSAGTRERFLRPGRTGAAVFGHELFKTGAGTGTAPVTAHREPDAYVLDGTTAHVANAAVADAHCVLAQVPDRPLSADTVALMVPAALPGIDVGAPLRSIDNRPSAVATEVCFDAVRVPVDCRVGDEGGASAYRAGRFEQARVLAACMATAAAERCLELAWEHCLARRSFGSNLHGHQGVRLRLAELRTAVEGSRQLDHAAVRVWADEGGFGLPAAAASLKAGRLFRRVAEECMVLFGAAAYMEGHPVSRLVADARLLSAVQDTDEAMLAMLAGRGGTDGR